MRVVLLNESFPEGMGYAGTAIPKTMRAMGVDVHYVTAGLPVYHGMPNYAETYGEFHRNIDLPGSTREVDGYQVHFLDYRLGFGGARLLGLREKLAELKPDIVQTLNHVAWPPLAAALNRRNGGYKLFTGNHTTASVYPLARMDAGPLNPLRIKEYLIRTLPGRFISRRIERCYGATSDCSEVARRFMGVPAEKLTTLPLGVETDVFHPATNPEEHARAKALREDLGVASEEIMCVYTGRFSDDKNPALLAEAVAEMRAAGAPYRAVFFGEGVQRDRLAGIEGTIVRPFVHYSGLADLYRAADIGVWPTQESTSMLDCAASGRPIVVNDTIAAVERVEGNGLTYRLNDNDDLKRALSALQSPETRFALGSVGAAKIVAKFSWQALVQVRIDDYAAAIGRV